MTARWRGAAILTAAAAATVVMAGACGKARKSGGGGGGGGGGPPVNEQVIAPFGFKIQITGATIPADPTAAATPPTVTFTVTDQTGAPINDLKTELQRAPTRNPAAPASGYPYINAPRFTLARLDPDNNYAAQYLTNAGQLGQAATSITLPRDDAGYAARVKENGNGSYTFQLDPLKTAPTADERGRTFTVGTWSSRRVSQGEQADEAAASTLNFVPNGGTPGNLQIVSLAACNRCHAPAVRAHGTRLGTQLCLTCHTAQTHDSAGTSVEFVELIHKIHYGADRPGTPYTIAGFTGPEAFDDEWINDVRNCTLCHQGANANLHLTSPSVRNCTTCHSIVHFDGTASAPCVANSKDTTDCNHEAGPVTTGCESCHTAAVLPQQHVSIFTIAQDFKYEIKSATVGQDGKPVIQFDVLNKGQPMDLSTDPAYKGSASSLNVQISWAPKDYGAASPSLTAPGQPRSIAIVRGGSFNPAGSNVTTVSGQTNVYQVTSPVALPSGVTSFTVFMDGHPVARGENVPVTNAVQSFSANGGTPDQRRKVVSIDNCNVCHGTLSWHGRNRNGSVETCVVCHNPHATDAQKRKTTSGETQPEAPVDFKYLIHAVHSADIRKDPLTVYEFNAANASTGGAPGKPEDFPGEIPHGVANCTMCHQGTTYEPPLPAEAQDTTIATNFNTDQGDDTTMPKTMAVCTSCHDQVHFDAASSSLKPCSSLTAVNSEACFHSGGAQTGDASCASCHGKGGAADVQRVHNVQ